MLFLHGNMVRCLGGQQDVPKDKVIFFSYPTLGHGGKLPVYLSSTLTLSLKKFSQIPRYFALGYGSSGSS